MPGSIAGLNKKRGRNMFTGYRYSVADGKVYISKLRLFNEFANPLYKKMPVDFFTTDCIIEKIYDVNTGEEVEEIQGKAWFPFRYKKGERITGTSIYYCKTRTALYTVYLYKGSGGIIKDRLTHNFIYAYEGESCFPGAEYIMQSIMKSEEDDEEELYRLLNLFLLKAEKKNFPDEERTEEEILHVDSLTFDNVPPELKLKPEYTMEECIESWKKYREELKEDT